MCTPAAIPLVASMAVTAVGALQSSQGAMATGKSQRDYYNYIADQNKQQAETAIKIGEARSNASQDYGAIEASGAGKRAASISASQTAAQAANGVAGSVTAADVLSDTATKANMDQQLIRYNADQKSWEAKTNADYQSWDYRNQEGQNRVAGKNAYNAAKIQSRTSLLQGAGSVLNSAYSGFTTGAFGKIS